MLWAAGREFSPRFLFGLIWDNWGTLGSVMVKSINLEAAAGVQNLDSPRLLSVADAQVRYGISKWTWREWAYEGKIASVKLGRRLMIPVDECERLVREGMRPALAK